MSSISKYSEKKSRLSLSLKRSHLQTITVENHENDQNEKLNKLSNYAKTVSASSNSKTKTENVIEEEEIIPCSQTEDKLIFSQKSTTSSNHDEAQASSVPNQKKINLSSAETHFSDCSLEHHPVKDSSIVEDKVVNNIQNDSTEIFDSPEAKVLKILNKIEDSKKKKESNVHVQEKISNRNSEIISSEEIDVIAVSDDEITVAEQTEWANTNKETVNDQEECNEIPISPVAKIYKIFKENEDNEESKSCEKKYNDLPPIIKRNVIIADSDEEFEEFANQKRKITQKKTENTNICISQKENSSTSKGQEKNKVISSSSCKGKSKVLKSHTKQSNVKASKEKSPSIPLKRKLEYNSDDEFEKPYKQVKKNRGPQEPDINKEVKKSKKHKKLRKSSSNLSTENLKKKELG